MQLKKYELKNIEGSKEYLELLHRDNKGYITIAHKNPNYTQWHYKAEELINNTDEILLEKINTYVSMNTFYKPQRRIENIKELNVIFIDIDCHKTKYSKEAVRYFLEKDLYGVKIPTPSFLIDSGRGLYYIVLIDKAPSQALPLWYAIERHIYNQLKEFGADPNALDPTRVLRVVDSINTKSNTRVKILDYNEYVYTLREIQEEYLPELKPKKEKSKGRPKKIVSLFNEYNLYYSRVLDIAKLCELRNYDLKGHREVILFLYRYYTCCFIEDEIEALEKVKELNLMFIQPLTDREVERDTRSAEKYYAEKKYKYSNDRLIEMLEITEQEQKEFKTIISTKEKYRRKNNKRKQARRNENGLTKKQQELEDLKGQVLELKGQGFSFRKIAEKLNITLGKVQRVFNK